MSQSSFPLPRRSAAFRASALLAALSIACCAILATSTSATAAPTIVSLDFDQSVENAVYAAPLLESFGLHGTFFANSCLVQGTPRVPINCRLGVVADPGQMSWSQLQDLYARGHEIGAHTLYRTYSTSHPEDICPDRDNLLAQGFAVTSFAYASSGLPFEQAAARGCGYNSARLDRGVRSELCPTCPFAQKLPAPNPFALASVEHGGPLTVAADMQRTVTDAAANGGGWVKFSFNAVCASCRHRTSVLTEFLTWLRDSAPAGTTVATSDQVIGGRLQPPSSQPTTASDSTPAAVPAPRTGSMVASATKDTVVPRMLSLSLTRRAFSTRKGTVIRYSTSELASVVFQIQQRVRGRRGAGGCSPARAAVPRDRRCSAYRTVGSFTNASGKLINRLAFRAAKARAARRAGSYRFRAVATDRAGNSSNARVTTFRVVTRR